MVNARRSQLDMERSTIIQGSLIDFVSALFLRQYYESMQPAEPFVDYASRGSFYLGNYKYNTSEEQHNNERLLFHIEMGVE